MGEACEVREAPFDHELIGFGTRVERINAACMTTTSLKKETLNHHFLFNFLSK